MEYQAGTRYLKEHGFLYNGNKMDSERLYGAAAGLAGMFLAVSKFECMDRFLQAVYDESYQTAYSAVVQMYKALNDQPPKLIKAFASVPNAWEEFVHMVSGQIHQLEETINYSNNRQTYDDIIQGIRIL